MVKVDFDLSGVKIPKKVAGVKVPKELRKKGKKLLEKANSERGREAIAAGLTIAATAIAAKARAKAARQAAHGAGPDAHDVPPVAPVPPVPPAPGTPGIDPANDLGAAIANGIGALQRFLKDKNG
jgi:hypothetical protein